MKMNIKELEQDKKNLEAQREQAIATIQQITGAISLIDKYINALLEDKEKKEDDKVDNKEDKKSDK